LSSFLPLHGNCPAETIDVPVKRLDEALDRKENRIFLKMDTQGYDLNVIEGAAGIVRRIVGLQSEISVTPLYDGMPHFTESLVAYERLGFRIVDLFVVNRLDDGSVLEYDCLMIRSDCSTSKSSI